MDQWFYAQKGSQSGPVDFSTLQSLVASGQLRPADLVWREGMGEWLPASSVDGLFAGVTPIAAAYAAQAGGPIPMSYYYGDTGHQTYVGFWWRFLAYWIDYIITYIASLVAGLVVGIFVGVAFGGSRNAQEIAGIIGAVFGLVIGWLYYALMESSKTQGTLGKMAIGVRVTDLEGNRIGFGRATGRFFAKILSGIILAIGFIMVGLTEKKQGLHDQLAGTLVLKGRPSA